MEKKIKVGSSVFFSDYPDYSSHDVDYLIFVDNPTGFKHFMHIRLTCKGSDAFYYKNMSKQEFIDYELKHCQRIPMAAGKILIPEVCKYFGFTIEDLKLFEDSFKRIDDKHKYEKVIYDAYIENGDFVLTEEQRNKAYQLYKEKRK